MTDIQERISALKKSGEEAAALAKKLLDNRIDPTDEHRSVIAKGLEDTATAAKLAAEFADREEKIRKSNEVKAALAAIGADLGLDYDPNTGGKPKVKMGSGSRTQRWAKAATEAIQSMGSRVGVADGVKALISGTISVPNLLDSGAPIEIDAGPTTLLDLIGRGQPSGVRIGNQHGFIRQETRTNNAAAVPDGADKPVSDFGFGEVVDHYRVFANKTEPIPWRYLDDYEQIIDVIRRQLAENNLREIEAQILSGTGPVPNADPNLAVDDFVGILNTSGIQAQAYTSNVLQTLSNAKYKFLSTEQPFNGWVLNPTDLQTLELMREDGATGAFLFPSRSAIEDFLGARVAPSLGITAGTALVGDFSQAEIIPLGDDELVVDGSMRTKNNTFEVMAEGRYGFRVKKPAAFVEVDLTA